MACGNIKLRCLRYSSIIKREINTVGSEVEKGRGIFMKMKRVIKAGICCLAFMGMVSVYMFSVKAAACSHKIFEAFYGVKTYYFEEDGHYGDCGPSYICADCGYQYWEDLELRYEKIGEHEWGCYTSRTEDGVEYLEAECTTPDCPYVRVIRVD